MLVNKIILIIIIIIIIFIIIMVIIEWGGIQAVLGFIWALVPLRWRWIFRPNHPQTNPSANGEDDDDNGKCLYQTLLQPLCKRWLWSSSSWLWHILIPKPLSALQTSSGYDHQDTRLQGLWGTRSSLKFSMSFAPCVLFNPENHPISLCWPWIQFWCNVRRFDTLAALKTDLIWFDQHKFKV